MYLRLHVIVYHSVEYPIECPYQLCMLQNVRRAVLDLTTAVRFVVLTVLMETVITLTDHVPVDVNQDTTLTRISYAIQVRTLSSCVPY